MNLTNWHKQGQGLDHLGHAIDCRCAECVRWWKALFTPLAGGPLHPEATASTETPARTESALPSPAQAEAEPELTTLTRSS